jgi:hypothetical protein
MVHAAHDLESAFANVQASVHSFDSSLRKQALGHIFLGQLLAFMWRNGGRDIEVLKSEVDRGGYDLVLESNGVIRHVQLKSSFRGSKVREVSVNTRLLSKPSGCILWLEFDPVSLAIEQFYWFGGPARAALPDLGERRSRTRRPTARVKKTNARLTASWPSAISGRSSISAKWSKNCLARSTRP